MLYGERSHAQRSAARRRAVESTARMRAEKFIAPLNAAIAHATSPEMIRHLCEPSFLKKRAGDHGLCLRGGSWFVGDAFGFEPAFPLLVFRVVDERAQPRPVPIGVMVQDLTGRFELFLSPPATSEPRPHSPSVLQR